MTDHWLGSLRENLDVILGRIEWGTAGEWVSGIGALSAVITSIWLVRHQYVMTLRARAKRLIVAMNPYVYAGNDGCVIAEWQLVAINTGQDPCYKLSPTMVRCSDGVSLSPTSPHFNMPLAPGETTSVIFSDGMSRIANSSDLEQLDPGEWRSLVYVTLQFEDLDGVGWQTTSDGQRRRLPLRTWRRLWWPWWPLLRDRRSAVVR